MSIHNVPDELKVIPQWSYSYSNNELKRPMHSKYVPNGALTAEQADVMAGPELYRGFYVTPEDPYVLVDIDHVENPDKPWDDLPDNIRSFMLARKTYWETSPSGKGLRGVLKLPLASTKADLKTKRALLISGNGTSTEAELHFGAPWMTMTGNKTSYSTDDVATVTIEDLQEIFNIKRVDEVVVDPELPVAPASVPTSLPNIVEIQYALNCIPLDQNNRIKRAYQKVFNQEYHHYDFWMKVMMAVHNYAQYADKNTECLSMVTEWSRDDPAFQSEEDVFNHWKSLSDKDSIITYKTLFKLQNTATLRWPVPKKQTDAEKQAGLPLKPNISAYENFNAVVEFYGIEFHRDALGTQSMFEVYISGDDDVLSENFTSYSSDVHFGKYYGPFNRETLIPCFNVFLISLGFTGLGHNRTREFLINTLHDSSGTVNFVKEYIETPLADLPVKYQENIGTHSSINDLFECLTIEFISNDHERELNLYRKYYLAWLLGLIRNLYYNTGKPNINNCVLVLTGKEQIRKTSHFKVLFPPFLRDYVAFTPHGFATSDNMRDLAKIAVSRLVVVWDEVEQFLNPQTESNFKKIIDNNPQTFVDKYEVHEKTITPIAIYGATSNQREFKLGDTGSRRMFIIPISWVDTDTMMQLCWHTIFHELLGFHKMAEEKGTQPWLLTEEELDFQTKLHGKFTARTDFDIMLGEIFDTNIPFEITHGSIVGITSVQKDQSGRLRTLKEVQDLIRQYDDSNISIKRPVLTRALERFCGKYTRTLRKYKEIERPVSRIVRGQIIQGTHKRWVFPPLTEEAKKTLYVFETKN